MYGRCRDIIGFQLEMQVSKAIKLSKKSYLSRTSNKNWLKSFHKNSGTAFSCS